MILPKTKHYAAFSLSLFLVKYSVLNLFFGACSHAVSHSGSLHSYKQTQKNVHLDLIVALKKGEKSIRSLIQ